MFLFTPVNFTASSVFCFFFFSLSLCLKCTHKYTHTHLTGSLHSSKESCWSLPTYPSHLSVPLLFSFPCASGGVQPKSNSQAGNISLSKDPMGTFFNFPTYLQYYQFLLMSLVRCLSFLRWDDRLSFSHCSISTK